jgi:hypothetical protein
VDLGLAERWDHCLSLLHMVRLTVLGGDRHQSIHLDLEDSHEEDAPRGVKGCKAGCSTHRGELRGLWSSLDGSCD